MQVKSSGLSRAFLVHPPVITRIRRLSRPVLLLAVLVLAGCGDILAGTSWDRYRGETPATQNITGEVVIVRILSRGLSGNEITHFYVDRIRYLTENDPHNVNRIVQATAREIQPRVHSLNLQEGDTLRISSRYEGLANGNAHAKIPNWPGHRYVEFPIGFHVLEAIEKVGGADLVARP
jgi:hypothetical protein